MMSNEYTHYTRDGNAIKISKMSKSHLMNTIHMIKREAEKGIVVPYGGGSFDIEDMHYEEVTLFGEEAEYYMDLHEYIDEAKRRGLLT